jgi:hypothetical protein
VLRKFRENSAKSAAYGLFFWVLSSGWYGCGFHSDLAALGRLRSRIHDEVGTDASVNVHSAYGSTTVTIRLDHLPPGDPKIVQTRVEALAKAEFPKTEYVVVLAPP